MCLLERLPQGSQLFQLSNQQEALPTIAATLDPSCNPHISVLLCPFHLRLPQHPGPSTQGTQTAAPCQLPTMEVLMKVKSTAKGYINPNTPSCELKYTVAI